MTVFYSLYCELCGYKKRYDDKNIEGLVEYKSATIPGGFPVFDGKEIKTKKGLAPTKKYKCPGCGRVVTLRKFDDEPNKPNRD